MTAAPTPMAEMVARKLALGTTGFEYGDLHEEQQAELCAGVKPVLDACHAEELQRVMCNLLAAIQRQPVIIYTEAMLNAVEAARLLYAKLESKP